MIDGIEAKWAHAVDALRAANERIVELEAEIARLKTAVTEWGDAAHRQAAEVARLTADRAAVPPDRERLITSLAELGTELMDAEWDAVELINDTIAALRSPAPGECEEMARHLLSIAGSGVSLDYDRFILREAAALLRALPLPPQEE